MKIFLVRHGMTDWNLERKWQGNVDIELNEIGLKQAENLGKRFKNEHFAKVYTSPLKRAYKTALPIAKNIKTEPKIIKDFMEVHVSLWNGYNINQVKKRFTKEFELWSNDPWAFVNGVESLGEVQQRGVKALKNVIAENNDNIVIVSHALLIRTIICWVLNLPLNQHRHFMLDNASVTTIEFNENKLRLLNLNETWHLDLEKIIHPKTVEEEI
ncbi:probable phosphoglycerate mutase [Marinitoga hydrogenitolerans DSM 16785]|uniref:Probable phosphoglycerate mutase n=1 Tax=Marinitoga hydrogenitolerans (strain DSM 16785 / JCM 12826 / AT1271) TaxID=1122195 RepID=A0A1M4SX09_MARH1|nr:histidine phosphatase family protein [Marinitoga hydrogenitolerans]SHE36678.1 probable phosphoglycerate mutase [Marinitoga hydrogenitolerans DSM 16785]